MHPFLEVVNRQSPKSYPKIRTVESVDEWIDGRIDPAQPHKVIHNHFIHLVVFDKGHQQVQYEERQPAQDKSTWKKL